MVASTPRPPCVINAFRSSSGFCALPLDTSGAPSRTIENSPSVRSESGHGQSATSGPGGELALRISWRT